LQVLSRELEQAPELAREQVPELAWVLSRELEQAPELAREQVPELAWVLARGPR